MEKNKRTEQKNAGTKIPLAYIIAALVIIFAAVYFLINSSGKKGINDDEEYMFKKNGELTFVDTSGSTVKIDIQIAQTEFDRQLGLMFRKSMNENQGMLFIFPDAGIRNFWMRNTEIPLDMIFVDPSKTILNIARNTTPYSDNSWSSTGPAKYVVEVNGGFTDRHKIRPGSRIAWTVSR